MYKYVNAEMLSRETIMFHGTKLGKMKYRAFARYISEKIE